MIPSPTALGYDPHAPSCPEEALVLWELYAHDPVRWIEDGCVQIQTQDEGGAPWDRLRLWPAQVEVVRALFEGRRVVVLKARQLGLTWLCAALLAHVLVFAPGSTALIVSLREAEAVKALDRARGIYKRLPRWMRARKILKGEDGGTSLELSTGSQLIALPSNRGDSYTARAVLVDEASLIPNLASLLASVEPAVGDQGRLWLVSRANKDEPEGAFARLAHGACVERKGRWRGIFLPWDARPGRDAAWYADQVEASLKLDGTLDTVQEQFPATPAEALAPRLAQVRIPWVWLEALACVRPLLAPQGPLAAQLLDLRLYEQPSPSLSYVIGADPAEGLPTSDDSALTVLEALTGRLVAAANAKLDTKQFPRLLFAVSKYFGHAPILVERNNHGHAVLDALAALGAPLVNGPDGRPGLAISAPVKTRSWDEVAAELSSAASSPDPQSLLYLPDPQTRAQLGSVKRRTLKAPDGQHDDLADAYRTAQWARANRESAWLDAFDHPNLGARL